LGPNPVDHTFSHGLTICFLFRTLQYVIKRKNEESEEKKERKKKERIVTNPHAL